MSITDNFVEGVSRYIDYYRQRREHRQTIDTISALPDHIRRDIGWPGAYDRQRIFRR